MTSSQKLTRKSRALTLFELLVVITLIAILAGLGLAGAFGIMNTAKNKDTALWITSLERGLTAYSSDNGIVPLNPAISSSSAERSDILAREGASILYRHLSGDEDLNGTVDPDADVYIASLAYEFQNSSGRPAPRSAKLPEGFAVIDPRGDLIRYLASPPNLPREQKITRNPAYDLWSLGGGSPDDPGKWISNWGKH